MTTLQLLIICATVLLLATLALIPAFLGWIGSQQPVLLAEDTGPAIGARIALHKLDGQAVEGQLEERTLDGDFVLSQVRIYSGPGATPADAGGRWTVLASRVEAVQEL